MVVVPPPEGSLLVPALVGGLTIGCVPVGVGPEGPLFVPAVGSVEIGARLVPVPLPPTGPMDLLSEAAATQADAFCAHLEVQRSLRF
jgi:hypothetical protein